MRGRRFVAVVGALLALVAVVAVLWVIAVLRVCDENSNVRRGSLPFRLCGIDSELIGSLPVPDPQGDAVFSWQNANGNKPGRKWLNYTSRTSRRIIRERLAQFLKTAGFTSQGKDGEFERWADGHTFLEFAIHPKDNGVTSQVEIVHNTGFD